VEAKGGPHQKKGGGKWPKSIIFYSGKEKGPISKRALEREKTPFLLWEGGRKKKVPFTWEKRAHIYFQREGGGGKVKKEEKKKELTLDYQKPGGGWSFEKVLGGTHPPELGRNSGAP